LGSHPPHRRIQVAKKVTGHLSVLFCPLRHQTPTTEQRIPGKSGWTAAGLTISLRMRVLLGFALKAAKHKQKAGA
jgi:hypothetical protein